jgi:hypothetical protein
LIFINRKREGFNTSQLLSIHSIISNDATDGDEKIKLLASPSFTINDSAIENIVNSEMFSNNEKILKIYAYFDELIDKRNEKPAYVENERIISFDNLFYVIKILQSTEFDEDTERILEIKKIGLIDDAFDAILNSDVSDSLKIINTESPNEPSLQNLINEIIYPVV